MIGAHTASMGTARTRSNAKAGFEPTSGPVWEKVALPPRATSGRLRLVQSAFCGQVENSRNEQVCSVRNDRDRSAFERTIHRGSRRSQLTGVGGGGGGRSE